jgi:signal transduction histidine kinase
VHRIVEEAVNDALRHTQASRIGVKMLASADGLELAVADHIRMLRSLSV